ncbi:glutamate formimidoyltransferase [Candidatus Darwinibacter acetoxidans]|jgi:glutamate formiminotransferase|nr:glutamate formimidoyltransferase [Limnochordia bacterium]MDI9465058.1 glutamate formimidoyltransferase [Bacillota bacterium]NLO94476.1 glutamate formimidoyltransferase [Bacillota bacterium]HAN95579.1 glutamate formimidoyltransferase [Bacillota bacterium]HOB40793.1 glutamate formimidoyltransferase [Limnochordia bacterium]
MRQIVQCVPNISEGRRLDVVERIVDEIRQTEGVQLLDYSSDHDHNRSVITFVGDLGSVQEAAFRLTRQAVELINMEEHQGAHPRIGAVDVIPLIPIEGVTMQECVEAAAALARRISEELEVPTYLYGEAVQKPSRRNLSDIRRGQYEGLKEAIAQPERHPDYGQPKLHPTAGATVVGARLPLIAFNVNLGTDRKEIADHIARCVRERSGGFRNVKAMGVVLEERRQVQVSMNLENYRATPIYRVLETIRREAARFGVPVVGAEIVGLVPQQALLDAAAWYLQLESFDPQQVLENRLR